MIYLGRRIVLYNAITISAFVVDRNSSCEMLYNPKLLLPQMNALVLSRWTRAFIRDKKIYTYQKLKNWAKATFGFGICIQKNNMSNFEAIGRVIS